MTDLPAKYGRYALVTGASSGIGAEFADQLADAGFDLVVIARRHDRLEALAQKIQQRTGRHVVVAPLDLAVPGAVDDLIKQTRVLDIGLVVAAAGVMVAGKFANNDHFAETATVQVNVLALMQLAQRFSAAMAHRGRGALILVSSTVGHAAVPYTANYAATKAYVSSLGRALHYELKPAGVDVLTLAPGPTDTEGFYDTEGIDFTALPMPVMTTEAVVRFALKKLGRRALAIPGVMNRFTDRLGKYVIPSSRMTALFGRMLAKATAPAQPTATMIRKDRAS
jgi:uncharacterized protein